MTNECDALRLFVAHANSPQFGSYGEALFAVACRQRGWQVEPVHAGRVDFLVNGEKIDVKSTKRLRVKFPNLAEGVRCGIVEFGPLGARIALEGLQLASLSWDEQLSIFDAWRSGRLGNRHTVRNGAGGRKFPNEIRQRVRDIFVKARAPEPYMLYRTIMFDKESPHNLLPSQRKPAHRKGWTVFMVFNRAPAANDTLDRIIAFPDSVDPSLPRLEKIRTGGHIPFVLKADVNKIPTEYQFAGFAALEAGLCSGFARQ